ncbi:MAG TPA: secretin N-terminal domain-containing protein [Thermoanaerobaculia bacterium]|nr:secretin N-terminal domain-containing protein [Thermoanaerobaculia bacterium]
MRSRSKRVRILALATLAVVAAGCTNYRTRKAAEQAEAREAWDEAVVHYLDLNSSDPGNVRWRSALLRAKLRASQEHFAAGRRFLEAGVPERALVELQQAVQLDPANQYAQVELDKVRIELESRSGGAGPTPTLDELKRTAREKPPQPPLLSPRSAEPISLLFPQPQSLFAIYQALGKAFGINILFDPQLRDQELAIELRSVTAQTALETLMRTAGHFYKVIDEHTILVAQDTPQNRKTYEDLVIQTFFLSNAEVKDVVQLVRSLLGSRNVAPNEQLNAITIRDTVDKVRIAQKLIEGIDKSRSEVVIDVELIQVNTTKLRELGVSLSSNQITQSLDLGEDAPIRLGDLRYLDQNSWVLTIPSIIYDFVKTNSDAQLLAKPQVRISEGEKANLHIGDKVPIPVTTFNTQQTSGGNIIPITSFQYQDVGIRIDIEPRVHHNKEITLKLKIEVSQITGFQDAGGGQRQPIIGTRTIESTIRLKDGETNFLAGLIRTDESNGETGIPGLSDIPVIGRLFGKTTTDVKRTDLMLTLTPHIIRTPDVTPEDLLPIWVGTESNLTFRGGSPRIESDAEGPFDTPERGTELLEEKIREQIEQLPPGLRTEEVPRSPSGSLAPSSAPSNPFDRPATTAPPIDVEEGKEDSSSFPAGDPLTTIPQAATAFGPDVTLAMNPTVASVRQGEVFQMAIEVDARVPVAHLPSTLAFDRELLEVVAVEPGEFLGGARAAEVLADTTTPGEVVVGASRLGGQPGVAGRGRLALVTFRALAPGSTSVAFAAQRAMGADLLPLSSVQTRPASVEVRPAEGSLGADD